MLMAKRRQEKITAEVLSDSFAALGKGSLNSWHSLTTGPGFLVALNP